MDLLLAVGSGRRNNPVIQQLISSAVNSLPVLSESDVDPEEMCAICLNSFKAVFWEEADYVRKHKRSLGLKETSKEGEDGLLLGLTKVEYCGHIFCRRDLAEWIRGFHGSCPTCRHSFLELPAESDDESTDGEYIPDEEDEADYLDFSDYTDADNLLLSEAELAEENDGGEATDDSEDEDEDEPAAAEFASAESDEEAPSDANEEYSDAASASDEDKEGSTDREESALAAALAQGHAEDLRRYRPLQRRVSDPEAARLRDEERRIQMMGPHLPSDWRARQFEAVLPLAMAHEAAMLAQEEEWRQQRLEEEAVTEREILRQLREVAEEEEELAEEFADAVDAMDDESAEDDQSSSGSDTFMDVYLSDSSSDLDYRPEDYMMDSDPEESDSEYMSSEFDYGVDELDHLAQLADPVTIHENTSNDSLLSPANTNIPKAASSTSSSEDRTVGEAAR